MAEKITKDQVTSVLKSIIHPSSEMDIVTMGIIGNVTTTDGKIEIELVFKSVNDPLKASLKKAVKLMLEEKFKIPADVKLTTEMKPHAPRNETPVLPDVKNIIAVASGKGGVGKSTVATNLALAFAHAGAKVGLIDADIFGPSVPKMLGIEEERPQVKQENGKDLLIPVEKYGIKTLSIGLFVNPEDATVWRGPMASNALKQLITDTDWGQLDYLFIDLPPGTSDIHLTLVQTVSVTGAIIVSTPQPVALADVVKGINMFRNENISVPVLGLIENMSWFTPEELPDHKYFIFGKDGCARLAEKTGLPLLGQIPLVQGVREGGDEGVPVVAKSSLGAEYFKKTAENLRIEIIRRNTNQEPTQKVEITRHRFSDFKK
jgi:ATP-binding protein involved in chromosome partitioning